MYQDERLLEIKAYLKKHKRISINQMIDLFGISRDTARRDLVRLEDDDEIIRTRGGAKLVVPPLPPTVVDSQEQFQSLELRALAKSALSLIKSGDRLLLDRSITVQYLSHLLEIDDVLVLTNSIEQVNILSKNSHANVRLLGGLLDKRGKFLFGASLIEELNTSYVDDVIIGATGFTSAGLYHSSEEEAFVLKRMTECGDQVIVLVEDSIIGHKGYCRSIDLDVIDIVIFHNDPGKRYHELLKEHDIQIVIANANR
ncbi:DeoR/GlpR family DNA-binding transcription regulator [Pseudalkalibacillus sp. SCS-8]|uniref:DeoR/GlpR family DNA-binding transcription regulator n=1 Tax=Pseudalkalibacillus nanhaiensis TaxID=3115291 RepID=UPI0032DAB4FF